MQILRTDSAIRIHPPSELTSQKWLVENFDSRRIFAVPEIAINLILYCLKPQEKEGVIKDLSAFYTFTNEELDGLIKGLVNNRLISVNSNSQDTSRDKSNSALFYEKSSKWTQYNWGSAAEYHFFTYDYPFLDYSEGAQGRQITNQRMNDYSAEKPDTNRIKQYPDEHERIVIPLPFDGTVEKVSSTHINNELCLDKLSLIAAFCLAKTTDAPIRWKGEPLIRRTSPSGGSRHPTEGYLIIFNVKNIESGIYHIQSAPFCFVNLKKCSKMELAHLFPDYFASNNPQQSPAAIIVLTSIFERNMFRYREPRTFRTIHMDAGHILGTAELISKHLGYYPKVSHRIDEKRIEQLIGLDGLSEGVISSVGIFLA